MCKPKVDRCGHHLPLSPLSYSCLACNILPYKTFATRFSPWKRRARQVPKGSPISVLMLSHRQRRFEMRSRISLQCLTRGLTRLRLAISPRTRNLESLSLLWSHMPLAFPVWFLHLSHRARGLHSLLQMLSLRPRRFETIFISVLKHLTRGLEKLMLGQNCMVRRLKALSLL